MRKAFVLLSLLFGFTTFAVERESTSTTNTSSKLLEISDIRRSLLNQWELSEQEWSRYEDLMLGIRGRLSQSNISPIEVLGIHARSETERTHYARIWARMMHEDALRVLQFQRAYDIEAQALNQDEPLIDVSLLPEATDNREHILTESDRALVFVSLDCPLCEIVFDQIYQRIDQFNGIDLYFVDSTSDEREQIREWAKSRVIDTQYVHSGKVTINYDDGLLESIDPKAQSLPILKRRREDEIKELTLDQLP